MILGNDNLNWLHFLQEKPNNKRSAQPVLVLWLEKSNMILQEKDEVGLLRSSHND